MKALLAGLPGHSGPGQQHAALPAAAAGVLSPLRLQSLLAAKGAAAMATAASRQQAVHLLQVLLRKCQTPQSACGPAAAGTTAATGHHICPSTLLTDSKVDRPYCGRRSLAASRHSRGIKPTPVQSLCPDHVLGCLHS